MRRKDKRNVIPLNAVDQAPSFKAGSFSIKTKWVQAIPKIAKVYIILVFHTPMGSRSKNEK